MKKLLLALLALTSAPASAQFEEYAEVDGWFISRSQDTGACGLGAKYDGAGSSLMTLVYYKRDKIAAIGVSNQLWTLKEGDKFPMIVMFIGVEQGGYSGIAHGMDKGFVVKVTSEDSDDIMRDFAAGTAVRFIREDTETLVDGLKLRGTGTAMKTFRACLNSLVATHFPTNPFEDLSKK